MSKTQTIYFGAGCFWCSEAAFNRLKGIESARSGYAGGHVKDPSYEQVSSGTTGHAEVVEVKYDPTKVTLPDLLAVFFTIHDPTTKNRQGYDLGPQYRSIILCTNQAQISTAKAFIAKLEKAKTFNKPIVTEVVEAGQFYPADESHYRYYELNKESAYCRNIIDPKLNKLKKSYSHLLK